MALTCARCGAQNPDGNAFCQACGTPLTAAAAGIAFAPPPGPPPGPPLGTAPGEIAGPPAGLAPPVQAMGGGYQSPYYVPTAPQAPVHRTPWTLIIGGVVVLVIVMAGCGTALAVIGRSAATTTGGLSSGLPSPTPVGSPTPLVTPTAPTSGPTTASNAGVVVPVPAGWTVASKDAESITVSDPNGSGFVTVASGPSNPAATAQQNKNQLDQYFKSHYPDTKPCPNTTTTSGSLNNAKGLFWTLCFTLTSGSRAAPSAAALFAGANGDGSVYYAVMELTTPPSNLQNVINESKPILQGIQWKL